MFEDFNYENLIDVCSLRVHLHSGFRMFLFLVVSLQAQELLFIGCIIKLKMKIASD